MLNLPTPVFTPIEPDLNNNSLLGFWGVELEGLCSELILQWTIDTFGAAQVGFAPSWSEEDQVVVELLKKMPEQIQTVNRIHELLLYESWTPLSQCQKQCKTFDGRKADVNLWKRFHLEHLCKMYEKTITGHRAWIVSTLRRQDESLGQMPILSWSERFGVFRIAPLARWHKDSVRKNVRKKRNLINQPDLDPCFDLKEAGYENSLKEIHLTNPSVETTPTEEQEHYPIVTD